MADENWTYEKWVERIECSATDNDLYRIVNEIYAQGHNDGYGEGFGDGKVHDCPHIREACEENCG